MMVVGPADAAQLHLSVLSLACLMRLPRLEQSGPDGVTLDERRRGPASARGRALGPCERERLNLARGRGLTWGAFDRRAWPNCKPPALVQAALQLGGAASPSILIPRTRAILTGTQGTAARAADAVKVAPRTPWPPEDGELWAQVGGGLQRDPAHARRLEAAQHAPGCSFPTRPPRCHLDLRLAAGGAWGSAPQPPPDDDSPRAPAAAAPAPAPAPKQPAFGSSFRANPVAEPTPASYAPQQSSNNTFGLFGGGTSVRGGSTSRRMTGLARSARSACPSAKHSLAGAC